MIVALTNSKGGVGKSTLAVHLAAWWKESGANVALVDAVDLTAAAARAYFLMPADFHLSFPEFLSIYLLAVVIVVYPVHYVAPPPKKGLSLVEMQRVFAACWLGGMAAVEATGDPMPEATLPVCRRAHGCRSQRDR